MNDVDIDKLLPSKNRYTLLVTKMVIVKLNRCV